MKNKFLSIACVFCIAIVGALNVNLTSVENGDVDLASIVNLSSANAENGPYGPPCVGGAHSACQDMIDDLEEEDFGEEEESQYIYDEYGYYDENDSYTFKIGCESGYYTCTPS
jgi:hypothetical protein